MEINRMNMDSNRLLGLDLTKLICSVLIVIIHIPVLNTVSDVDFRIEYFLSNYLGRIAVPFFFISSGYLLFRKCSYDNLNLARIKRYILKILRLYIVWSCLYFPLSLKNIFNDSQGIRHGVLCYIRDFFLTGSYLQLWYLNALIVGVACTTYFLYRKISIRKILLVSGILYCFGVLTQSWYGLLRPMQYLLPTLWNIASQIGKVMVTTRNGVFFGFFFIAIGASIAFKGVKISKNLAKKLFVAFMLLYLVENIICRTFNLVRENAQYFLLAPTVYFMFLWIIQIKLSDWEGYIILRKLSACIFYSHMWAYVLMLKLLSVLQITDVATPIIFFITLGVTIAGSLTMIKLSECSPFYWLKYLYD